jgi:hypothetical protein
MRSSAAIALLTVHRQAPIKIRPAAAYGRLFYAHRDFNEKLIAPILLLPALAFGQTVHLTDYMNSHYGIGAWAQRTAVGNGTDIGPALVDALTYIRSQSGRGEVVIDAGNWEETTAPKAAQLSGIYIKGLGSQASLIFYNANSGSPLSWSGANGYTGGGTSGRGILLEAGYGNSSATAITLQGDATYQPDQTEFNDLYITALGNSYWYNGFFAFGNARTIPQGIRVGYVTNVQIFRCWNTGWYLSNIVQWTFDNIGAYVGM